MKIKSTITEKKTIEKEIELPYFCKSYDKYWGMESKDDVTQVNTHEGYLSISKSAFWVFETDIAQAEPVSQDEYTAAFENTIQSILNPVKEAV